MNRLHLDLNRAPGIFPSWRAFFRALGPWIFFAVILLAGILA